MTYSKNISIANPQPTPLNLDIPIALQRMNQQRCLPIFLPLTQQHQNQPIILFYRPR
jgi:hypothetical protein